MNKTNLESMLQEAMSAAHFYSIEWINGNNAVEKDMHLWEERIDLLEKLLSTF